MIDLSAFDVKFLPGIGPQRAAMLEKEIGVRSLMDLLYYFPYKYVDRSCVYPINQLNPDMPYVQVCGQILSFEEAGQGRGKRLIAHLSDGTGYVDLVWFIGNRKVSNRYRLHTDYIVFGKPSLFGGRVNIVHPDIDKVENVQLGTLGMQPYYNTTEKMKRAFLNSRSIEKMMAGAIQMLKEPLPETLTEAIIQSNHLMSLTEALRAVHFPRSSESLRQAQLRLKFEELFYVQLNILRYTNNRKRRFRGLPFTNVGAHFNAFYHEHLPFRLTDAQKRVLREIRADLGSGRQMNRLLQGDVGSGKTIVALMTALLAIDNGFQACIMAPTEILAEQHYQTVSRLLDGMDVCVELLTGSVRGKRREDILERLKGGDIGILVGTHALIEETVGFASLGLAIIDEQHRFGVAQRARLWAKNSQPPHILVMTATPIPRTLAMTLYGDLDVSVIDQLPPGRKPIATLHQLENNKRHLFDFIRKQIAEGRQVYMVYPLIKESEKIDLKNLENGYEEMCAAFPDMTICKVHGQMKSQEKERQMQLFASGKAQMMVATTVIEVGVNVPNASVMVIENAERFGLSQLHQLRGRVGRGVEQSYCILVTDCKLSEDTRKRIEIMVRTNDGFEIAEADLRLRGPGNLEGTQQSGMPIDLKIANLARDGQILQLARDAAAAVIESDPTSSMPENAVLWNRLKTLSRTYINWGEIS